jgi:hypothetical protein
MGVERDIRLAKTHLTEAEERLREMETVEREALRAQQRDDSAKEPEERSEFFSSEGPFRDAMSDGSWVGWQARDMTLESVTVSREMTPNEIREDEVKSLAERLSLIPLRSSPFGATVEKMELDRILRGRIEALHPQQPTSETSLSGAQAAQADRFPGLRSQRVEDGPDDRRQRPAGSDLRRSADHQHRTRRRAAGLRHPALSGRAAALDRRWPRELDVDGRVRRRRSAGSPAGAWPALGDRSARQPVRDRANVGASEAEDRGRRDRDGPPDRRGQKPPRRGVLDPARAGDRQRRGRGPRRGVTVAICPCRWHTVRDALCRP